MRSRAMMLSGFVSGLRVMPLVISGVAFPGLLCGAPIAVAEVKRDGPVDFAKDIHPLLKRSCLACHNTTKAKAGLNLESPAAIMKGGDTGREWRACWCGRRRMRRIRRCRRRGTR